MWWHAAHFVLARMCDGTLLDRRSTSQLVYGANSDANGSSDQICGIDEPRRTDFFNFWELFGAQNKKTQFLGVRPGARGGRTKRSLGGVFRDGQITSKSTLRRPRRTQNGAPVRRWIWSFVGPGRAVPSNDLERDLFVNGYGPGIYVFCWDIRFLG